MKRLLSLLLALSCSLSADDDDERITAVRSVHLEINSLQQLDTAPFLVQLPAPTAADYEAGFIQVDNAVEVTVWSNVSWRLFIKRLGQWQNVSTGALNPDLSIAWNKNNQTRFRDLSDQERNRVGQGRAINGRTFRIHLKVPISWQTLSPGTWQVPLEFKLIVRS